MQPTGSAVDYMVRITCGDCLEVHGVWSICDRCHRIVDRVHEPRQAGHYCCICCPSCNPWHIALLRWFRRMFRIDKPSPALK